MGIQRKKQYPDLAHRPSEVIRTDGLKDAVDQRTHSEERGFAAASKSGPRSRSAEPSVGRQHQKTVMVQSYPPVTSGRGALMPKMEELPNLAEGVQKNTEYRTQFAWPRHSAGKICTARKSISMGLIKAPDLPDAPVLSKSKQDSLGAYQRLPTQIEEAGNVTEKPPQDSKKKNKTEYKAKYKPFTSYVYIDGQWKKTSRLVKIPEHHGSSADCHPWYSEVMERLQRANEYKCRGHGHTIYGEQLPFVYASQGEGTPLVRPKKDLPQLHIPILPESKSTEGKKKERKERHERKEHERKPSEKKPEKEPKREPKRPKSADPEKARKPRTQKRPQTAPPPSKERPPLPVPAHHAYARRAASKSTSEARTKSTSRPPSTRKSKEDPSRSGLPSDGRASRTSYHPPASSGGKVWLQAGAPVQTAPSEGDSFKGKHSDAVRPSTLLPPKPKSPPPAVSENPGEMLESELLEDKEQVVAKASPAPVPLTHVQTPEEVTGVKSPEPENWTVPLDKGKKLQWTESSTNEPLLPQAKIASPKAEVTEKEEDVKVYPENPSTSAEAGPVPVTAAETQKTPVLTSAKAATADVLDRARSRLDQFWGKSK